MTVGHLLTIDRYQLWRTRLVLLLLRSRLLGLSFLLGFRFCLLLLLFAFRFGCLRIGLYLCLVLCLDLGLLLFGLGFLFFHVC